MENLESFLERVVYLGLGPFFGVVLAFGPVPGPVVVVDDLLAGAGLWPGVASELVAAGEAEVLACVGEFFVPVPFLALDVVLGE